MKDLKNRKETSIQEALTEIDAEFIDESVPDASASAGKTEKKGRTLLYVLIAAAVVLLLIAGTVTTVLHLREKPPAGSDIPLSGAETENSAEASEPPANSEVDAGEATEAPGQTDALTDSPEEGETPAETESPTPGDSSPGDTTSPPEEYLPWIAHAYSEKLQKSALATPVLPDTLKQIPNPPGQFREMIEEAKVEYDKRMRSLDTEKIEADLRAFTAAASSVLLSGADGENRVYSPLNVYFTLAALARITEGDTRAQILSLLGEREIDKLADGVRDLWNKLFIDDGVTKCVSSSSLWLNEGYANDYDRAAINELAEKYAASVFSGDMDDPAYADLFESWLAECTDGLLDGGAGDAPFSSESVLTLAMTMLYASEWETPFDESAIEGIFHTPSGDVAGEFMRGCTDAYVAFGEKFTAADWRLSGGSVLFILPEEGCAPKELFSDEQALRLISAGTLSEDVGCTVDWANVDLTIPEFDVSSTFDLPSMLESFGLKDCTDSEKADFSGILDGVPVAVTGGAHTSRVIVDEYGVRAAAFTGVEGGMGGPDLNVSLMFDRPFIFAVYCGATVFVGVVNDPNA